jgi:hypothetical protein
MIDYSNVQETDWLTRGVSEKQLQKEKKQALRQIARMRKKEQLVNIKFKTEIRKYTYGVWSVGISLAHIPDETILYIKLFKWYIMIGYVNDELGWI